MHETVEKLTLLAQNASELLDAAYSEEEALEEKRETGVDLVGSELIILADEAYDLLGHATIIISQETLPDLLEFSTRIKICELIQSITDDVRKVNKLADFWYTHGGKDATWNV
jgi:hypothetical protein